MSSGRKPQPVPFASGPITTDSTSNHVLLASSLPVHARCYNFTDTLPGNPHQGSSSQIVRSSVANPQGQPVKTELPIRTSWQARLLLGLIGICLVAIALSQPHAPVPTVPRQDRPIEATSPPELAQTKSNEHILAPALEKELQVPLSPKTGKPIPTAEKSPPGARILQDARIAMEHIQAGTEPPWDGKWGAAHGNFEGNLPRKNAEQKPITYREYYLPKSPGDTTKWGPNRLVVGSDGNVYVTTTHYGQSGDPPFVYVGSIH